MAVATMALSESVSEREAMSKGLKPDGKGWALPPNFAAPVLKETGMNIALVVATPRPRGMGPPMGKERLPLVTVRLPRTTGVVEDSVTTLTV